VASDPVFAEHDTVPATPSARRGCGPSTTASGARRSPTRSWSWSAARPGARSSTGPPADYSTRGGALRAGGGFLDSDTVVSRGSWRAARPRPGRLAAVDGLRRGEADAAFLAVRPPGHHALPDRAMGFCLINNVAVTAAALPPGVSGCAWSTTRPHATGPARVLRRLARRVRVVSRVAALPRHRPPRRDGYRARRRHHVQRPAARRRDRRRVPHGARRGGGAVRGALRARLAPGVGGLRRAPRRSDHGARPVGRRLRRRHGPGRRDGP